MPSSVSTLTNTYSRPGDSRTWVVMAMTFMTPPTWLLPHHDALPEAQVLRHSRVLAQAVFVQLDAEAGPGREPDVAVDDLERRVEQLPLPRPVVRRLQRQ